MKPVHTVVLAALLLGSAAAQGEMDLPTISINPTRNELPVGLGDIRYGQWFSRLDLTQFQTKPVRITGMAMAAASNAQGQVGRTITAEITMAHSLSTSPTGDFEGNMVRDRTTVFPRGTIGLNNATPGTFPLTVTFVNEFRWDGSSSIVVDMKIFDNGNNNQPYGFDFQLNVFTNNRTARFYTVNNPQAPFASFGPRFEGVTTRFFYNEANTWNYGAGCPGEGRFIPVATNTGGFPIPGNTRFAFQLNNAPSQRSALFFIGGSNTAWGSLTLPYSLRLIGAPGCSVLAEPVAAASLPTVGGGPGQGIANFAFTMPARTDYLGTTFYSQWLVLDPNAPQAGIAMSNGLAIFPALQ